MEFIKATIGLLYADEWYVDDEYIKIAKGKYKAPTTLKELKENIKRQ